SCNVSKLVSPNEFPFFARSGPFRQGAAGRGGIHQGVLVLVLTIVRVDHATLSAVESLSLVAGQRGGYGRWMRLFGKSRLGRIPILDEAGHFQAVNINFVERFLHGGKVDLVRRVGEMTRVPSQTTGHHRWMNHPHISLRIDEVGADG